MATKKEKTVSTSESPAADAAADPAADPAADAAAGPAAARARLAGTGRNDACPCGSGKKYKKCHLAADEQATATPPTAPDAQELVAGAWRLFEQRRPGAAEKEFKAALAIDATLIDARVGIGMARLSAGNADGAKEELGAVIAATEEKAEALRKSGARDGFTKPEVQPYIRAAHALGCLAYDEDRFADAVTDLARVHSIDDGAVGLEARLIAAKSLMKLEKAAEAAELLEPATKFKEAARTSGSRSRSSRPATRPPPPLPSKPRWRPTRTTPRRCSGGSGAGSRTSRPPSRGLSRRRCSTPRPTATSGTTTPRRFWPRSSMGAPPRSRRKRPPRPPAEEGASQLGAGRDQAGASRSAARIGSGCCRSTASSSAASNRVVASSHV
jgi:tetratricopeptide (TPR) repeat protein